MLNKEGELVLVGLLNANDITRTVNYTLQQLQLIITDYCLLGPVFDTLCDHLVEEGLLKTWFKTHMEKETVTVKDVVRILKTPKFIKDVPKVSIF
jgi:hypothetical protein